ncbi:MAG TPA: SRPBCC family protein [Candidatus Dormibacteraeota bacterium]|nr:SRPBCC family protein [Candidatus Dormibacteraeota bacterium]
MVERRFSARVEIARGPGEVFDWVADYRNASLALEGVSRWRPLTGRTRGPGARFEVSMEVLGVPLENVLVLDLWDRPRAIGWRSESGLVPQTGRWRFEPCDEGTAVSLTIAYRPPGGALGSLVLARADDLVRGRLRHALERMKVTIEAGDGAG